MKKYKEIMYFGFNQTIYNNGDMVKNYNINHYYHGYYISWSNLNSVFWLKGYCNMNMEYSHWELSHENFRYKYFL